MYRDKPWEVKLYAGHHPYIPDVATMTISQSISESTALQNARLIAAAPEMLEACKEAMMALGLDNVQARIYTEQVQAINKLSQAIARAEGR